MIRKRIAAALLLLSWLPAWLPATAWAVNYLVWGVFATPVHVSSIAANGMGVGDDATCTGLISSPCRTWDKGMSLVKPGGLLKLNCTLVSPQLYQSATTTDITQAMTVEAVVSGCAKLAGGTSANYAVNVNPSSGGTVKLKGVVVDPSLNSGGAAADGVRTASPATLYTFIFEDSVVQNWTDYCINSPSNNHRAQVIYRNSQCNGGTVLGGIRLRRFIEGGFLSDANSSVTLTAQNASGEAGIYILAAATGVSCRILDTTINVASIFNNGSFIYGGVCSNIANAEINGDSTNSGSRKTWTVSNSACSGSTQKMVGASVQTNKAGDATELPSNDSIIRNLIVSHDACGGSGVQLSGESGDKTKQNRLAANNITVTGTPKSQTGTLHALFAANCTDCSYTNSGSTTAYHCFVDKLNLRLTASNITGSDCSHEGGLAKGSDFSAWSAFSMTLVSGNSGAAGIIVEDDGAGTNTTNFTSTGHAITNNGGTGTIMVLVKTLQAFTPSNGSYTQTSGTLDALPFQNEDGTDYADCATYQPTETGAACSGF